jgi:hypothetical protein
MWPPEVVARLTPEQAMAIFARGKSARDARFRGPAEALAQIRANREQDSKG